MTNLQGPYWANLRFSLRVGRLAAFKPKRIDEAQATCKTAFNAPRSEGVWA